jgi:hypothetical protein
MSSFRSFFLWCDDRIDILRNNPLVIRYARLIVKANQKWVLRSKCHYLSTARFVSSDMMHIIIINNQSNTEYICILQAKESTLLLINYISTHQGPKGGWASGLGATRL